MNASEPMSAKGIARVPGGPEPGARLGRGLASRLGFSLIEVTMALGITAAVLVPLIALLPYSMNNMREAIDVSISSRILEEITSEAQLRVFEELIELEKRNNGIRYYDSQGNDISAQSGGGAKNAIYTARVRVPAFSSKNSPDAVRLPGAPDGMGDLVQKIEVEVAITRGQSFNFNDPKNFEDIEKFATFVPKLRSDYDTRSSGN